MTVAAEIGAHILLFLLVFGMSATVDIGHMRKQMRNRKAIGTGIALQFFILPFVGFCIVKILKMPAPLGITLLVVTSSPGGSYSNCK
jgi:predicted Na+-dependent transporter